MSTNTTTDRSLLKDVCSFLADLNGQPFVTGDTPEAIEMRSRARDMWAKVADRIYHAEDVIPLVSIIETRYYNGAIEGYDQDSVYQVNFESSGSKTWINIWGDPSLRDPNIRDNWTSGPIDAAWLAEWYPQIVRDIQDDPLPGFEWIAGPRG